MSSVFETCSLQFANFAGFSLKRINGTGPKVPADREPEIGALLGWKMCFGAHNGATWQVAFWDGQEPPEAATGHVSVRKEVDDTC